jgi:PIN domain nuclease of toxin-antitoxin system
MRLLLADTHTLLWFLFNPTRLSRVAKSALDAAVDSGGDIYASIYSNRRIVNEYGRNV